MVTHQNEWNENPEDRANVIGDALPLQMKDV